MFRYNTLFSFIAGAVTVLAFAPFDLYVIPFFSVALVFYLWSTQTPQQAAINGFFFGLGLLGFGVFWLHVSISKFGGVSLPLAMLLALLFAASMALFYALAGWLANKLIDFIKANLYLQFFVIYPAVWGLLEILRAYFLTGFPWLSLGYSQLDFVLVNVAPLLGVFGISWFVALLAALLVLLVKGKYKQRYVAGSGIALLCVFALIAGQWQWSEADGDKLSVRLVQANIPQELKWQPANLLPTVALYSQLSFEQHADLIVWPETAIPAYASRVEKTVLSGLEEKLQQSGSKLVLGIPMLAGDHGYFNSMMSLGEERDYYHKRHLVPFGEYAPLDFLLRPLVDYFRIPMSDFRAGEAEQPLLQVGQHQAGVSICYEDAFGDESAQALPQATYLINVSNDAWFGDSLAPYQHLQIARMRAVETGRFMIRATNTGISAIINPGGQVLQQSSQGETAVLQDRIQPMQGITPYARYKDGLMIALLTGMLLLAVVLSIRSRQQA